MGAIALRSVSSYSIWGPLQISFFTYNMEAPSDLFLCILYGGPFGSVSLLTIRAPAPQVSFFTYYIWSPLIFIQFLRVKLSLGGPHMFEFPGGRASASSCPPPCGRPCTLFHGRFSLLHLHKNWKYCKILNFSCKFNYSSYTP